MNSVSLVGRLAKDPELRKTSAGKSICKFTIAVSKKGEGADFIDCVAWDKLADNLCNYQSKGNMIGVSGCIATGTYKNKEGQNVKTFEINCSTIDFMTHRSNAENKNGYGYTNTLQNQNNATSTHYESENGYDYSSGYEADTVDIQSDDLPF